MQIAFKAKPRLLCLGNPQEFLAQVAGNCETYGIDHRHGLNYDRLASAVDPLDEAKVDPIGNIRAEEGGFDVVHLQLPEFPSETGAREERLFNWARDRVRVDGLLAVTCRKEQIGLFAGKVAYLCRDVVVSKTGAWGDRYLLAGLVEPRRRSWYERSAEDEARFQHAYTRRRLAEQTALAYAYDQQAVSLLPTELEAVREPRRQEPVFFSYLLDRRSIGAAICTDPLAWLSHELEVSQERIRIPKEMSIGNLAKVAADGQMDGVYSDDDGIMVLAKGFAKQVKQTFTSSADGETETVTVNAQQVFITSLYLNGPKRGGYLITRLA